MGDDITIGVTEIVNNIEVTAQPNDQIVDISVIDNADDVTLNITPTVIEINVNKGSSYAKWGTILGTLSDQTDLQDALDLKADLVDGKVPSSQLPSYVDDVIEVANYASLPATGETGKIYLTLDTNHIYRWTGSTYVEITDNTAVWGAITGTLSSQTDLQSALNLKVPYTGATSNVNLGEYGLTGGFLALDTTPTSTPTGIGTIYWDSANRTAALIDGDGDTTLQIGQEQRILVHNNTGSTLTDGQVVYVTGSTGNLPSVALASATIESTSAATIGVVTESIAHGTDGFITTSGIVNGLNTNAFNEGDLLWLGTTAGTFSTTKPISPNHLVLIGYVIKKAGGNGSILVKIQNTQELDECSDVLFSGLANNDLLVYETASALWKNKSLATVLGYTPANDSNVVHKTGNESIAGWKTFTGGITLWDNSSNNLLDFFISGTEVGSISVGSSFFQFKALNSNGYLFQNNSGSNSLTISNSGNGTFLGSVTATSIIKTGGTSSQFLKADGSVDSTSYQPLLTNPITGTGTTNYLSKFTGSGTLGNSLIYDNGTNIGIGTTSPNEKLTVIGKVYAIPNLPVVLGGVGAPYYGTNLTLASDTGSTQGASRIWSRYDGTGSAATTFERATTVQSYNSDPQLLTYTETMRISGSGNVGIGTTSPDNGKLTILKNTSIATESSYGIAIQSNTSNVYTELLLGADDTVDCGVIQTAAKNTSFTTKKLALQPQGGNVGIGTTAPQSKFAVSNGGAQGIEFGYSAGLSANYIESFNRSNNLSVDMVYFLGSNAGNANHRFYTSGSERMRITSSGDIFIGSTSAANSEKLGVNFDSTSRLGIVLNDTYTGVGSSNNILFKRNGSNVGSISTTTTTTSYNTTSDYRLKEDFKNYSGLDLISNIKTYDFKWKNSEDRMYGVIAHELQEVVPYAVNGEKDAEQMQQVDYSKLVPILVNAIKELNDKINKLENK